VGDTDKLFLYPKASASVQLASFDFWDPLRPTLSQFKLRGAFGRTGNLPQANAKYTSLVAENITGLGGVLVPTRRGNPDIEPETTQELEFGVDLAFLDDRGTVEFTYYTQDIRDIILENELPKSSGYATEFINAGDMQTRGVELALEVIPVRSGPVNWQSTVTFARDRSEITALDIDPFQIGGFALSLGQFQIEEGRSPTTIVGLDADGNLTVIGNSNASFQLGWMNNVRVGGFNLGFLWDWKEGGDVINLGKLITDLAGTTPDLDTPEGQERLNRTDTERYVEDGTYLKLREANLSYDVPQAVLTSWFNGTVRRLSLGVGGRNLLMFTPYEGYDPEVSQFGNVAVGRAVDVLPFPSSRNFYFKVGLGF
jgi:outer membrane receptor protein involved in Fe transport